jgi:hypothetical protein
MKRSAAGAVAVLAFLFSVPAVASADPPVPQADTPCPANLSEFMTWPSGAKMPLVCQDGRWQTVTTPQPPSDRWLSYGPEMTLHGEGIRNPEVRSGKWTATPQDSASRCRAEQSVVVSPGVVSQPETAEAQAGQPLEFTVLPRLFDLQLSGFCLWQRVT